MLLHDISDDITKKLDVLSHVILIQIKLSFMKF